MELKIEPLEFEKPIFEIRKQLAELREKSDDQALDLSSEIETIEGKLENTKNEVYSNLTAWQRVQIARHTQRPFMLDYIRNSFDDFVELHGDRHIGDDNAMPAGFATIGDHRVIVTGHQKGRNTKENLHRNFGSAHPEGYRKALRLMRLAEKFQLPIVTLIDTPGAFPGIGAEERNIAEAIAFNLREMASLKTPVIAVVIGEGGSGGALGIGVADRVLMLENAYYSVISPEGCAAILWKDRKYATEAAEALKITAVDLKELGIVDTVISEPPGGAHYDLKATAQSVRDAIVKELKILKGLGTEQLLDDRYAKLRAIGQFTEA
ncbi:MAG: acetyl-CoA carboxylase carboxyl transferase subunit alpha [Verrucomicrobiales bacterium]|jgi:acetyl-CoA carboxylase carboxyl transferase subunit alpha